jgi:hypothetical protein
MAALAAHFGVSSVFLVGEVNVIRQLIDWNPWDRFLVLEILG